MGKRGRKRRDQRPDDRPRRPPLEYADAEGNRLLLRAELKPGALASLSDLDLGAAANVEDQWQRRTELLFELLAVEWVIFGLPITRQQELLGRYRMADSETRSWVRATLEQHLAAIGADSPL